MTYLYGVVLAVIVLLGGIAWYEHHAYTAEHDDFTAYKATAAADIQAQKDKNAKDATAAALALSNAEKQNGIDNAVHAQLIDHLNSQLRNALAWHGGALPGPVANPHPVQGGSAGAGQGGSLQPVIDRVLETKRDYDAACLGAYDDLNAIKTTEPPL